MACDIGDRQRTMMQVGLHEAQSFADPRLKDAEGVFLALSTGSGRSHQLFLMG
jgi:hypothetical protein